MVDTPADQEHRFRVAQACRRRLDGEPPQPMGAQLAALTAALTDPDARGDRYGGGPVTQLEERVAELLGKPAAAFFPTGTMAQQVALRCWAGRTGNATVALHPQSHPEQHERHALSTLSGLRTVWPTAEPRQPTPAEIRDLDEPVGTVMFELPLREPGYLLPTWDELVELVAAARERGARVHFDGARLWESTPQLGQDLATVAGLADSVYVSFYKTLGGLSGAALAGPADFIAEARAWGHRYGGRVFQQWPAALSALAGLDTVLPRIPSYVEHAKSVAAALSQLPGARVHPDPPQTHEFQLWLPHPAEALNRAVLALAEEEQTWFAGGWTDRPPTGLAYTEISVTASALAWSVDDVIAAGHAVLRRAAEEGAGGTAS
jgi:threonine aldolase